MNLSKLINSKIALISVGVVLAGYLILVFTVISLGQGRLKESQHNEFELKIDHYANTLSYFFNVSQENMQVLSNDKTLSTFFHNSTSGMSMTYGLSASLFKLESLIDQITTERKVADIPIFKRLSLINLDGSIILDNINNLDKNTVTNNLAPPFDLSLINIETLIEKPYRINIKSLNGRPSIKLLQLVLINDNPIAVIVAELNNAVIIQQLTSQEHLGRASRLELSSDAGNLFIWNSMKDTNEPKAGKYIDISDQIFLEVPIKSTPLTLIAWHKIEGERSLFTSHWFVLIISLLIIPLFWGLYYLVRIDHNNTILQTEVNASHIQQQQLSMHNYQLQKEINKRRASEKTLEYQATHDSLTGLANRNYSLKKLSYAIEVSKRNKTKILIMYIDLDNFKQINDTLGHSIGDQVLIESSKRLIESVRKTDTVARLGGDEFLIIFPELQNNEQASMLAMQILSRFEHPFEVHQQTLFSSTSIGLSIYPQDGDSPGHLLKSADMALYRVKDAGRNSFNFYNEAMNADVMRNVAIDRRLRYAIENKKLEMHYQPLVELKTGKIVGAEALMRWVDEELGFVPPDEFIIVAERNGLINTLGEFALTEACSKASQWQNISPLHIAVNFSSVQFRDCRSLLLQITDILKKTNLPSSKLEVEVTESLLINQGEELNDMLTELRNLNIQLSIDDFGTGYSALSYLQKYAFSKLKIDRAFVMNLEKNEADQSLVTAIIAMAKALNMKVVAEGIEEQEQIDFLKQLDCEYGQGYLFSKALPAPEFEKLLRNENSSLSLA